VLPIALPQRTVAYAARRGDGILNLRSAQNPAEPVTTALADLGPGSVSGWAAYPAGVAWALREAGHPVDGADVLVDGDVPVGAGLSSSAALECAVALALAELSGLSIERGRLARLAQRAENDFVGMPCGIMDQTASLLATEDHALLLDTRSGATRQIPLQLAASGLALLVIDTKAPHRLVGGEYAARRRDCEHAARILGMRALRDIEIGELDTVVKRLDDDRLRRRVRHVVTENGRVMAVVRHLDAGRPQDIGELLTASHASLRDEYEVSSPELDLAVETALRDGALGARMTGGGFGGCAIALVNADAVETLAGAVRSAFARRGFQAPEPFVTRPSGGAGRIDA
jgi:galactokinase